MIYIQQLLQNIAATHENIRAKVPNKARWGIVALLAVLSFIILIFQAEWLMTHLVALLPIFYVSAVLAVGFKRALYGTAIFLFFCFALWLRTGPPHEGVLGGSYVMFAENDGWYNMRLVENLVYHFPFRNSFDPYTLYPYGQSIGFAPFFDWFLALIIWVAGLGHPSAELIEKIGAYFPAVLGALTIVPVYFIGKELFNRNAGLLCAGLLAIAPGEFLFRSILGFTDHHVAEVLLCTTTILFLILAINSARDNSPTFGHIRNKEWTPLKKPLIFSLAAGFTLGFYLCTWAYGMLAILVIFTYSILQVITDHLKGKSTDYLVIIFVPIYLVGLIMSAAASKWLYEIHTIAAASIISILGVCVSVVLSRIMIRKNIRRFYYPFVLAVLGLAGVGLFYAIAPSTFHWMTSLFSIFSSSGTRLTIMEAQPLLADLNISSLTDHRVWSYFTTGIIIVPIALLEIIFSGMKVNKNTKLIFLGCVALVLLTIVIDQFASFPPQLYIAEFIAVIAVYSYFEKNISRSLFLIWSVLMLLLTMGQTRFAYYLAINVALLSGYLLWRIPSWITQLLALLRWKEAPTADKAKTRAEKRRIKAKEQQPTFNYLRPKYVSGVLSVVIIFFLTVYPNLIYGTYNDDGWSPKYSATMYLTYHPYGPNTDWHEALTWMRDNTPDPFGDPDFYYELYDAPKAGEAYDYPDSAYGVMSWWDYGHWITRIARRIPNANPFQSGIGGITSNGSIRPGASTFMTAQDETTASEIMDELDSKYVVIDIETAYGKYHTMVTWSGGNVSDYYDILYRESNGELRTYNVPGTRSAELQIFYLPYYQSMCARLYNFGAAAAVPNNSTLAILFSEKTDENGQKYKVVADVANDGKAFPNYEQAQEFLNDHPGYVIAGLNPFSSPIPLEALEGYALIHSSPVPNSVGGYYPYVKIFEYTGYEK